MQSIKHNIWYWVFTAFPIIIIAVILSSFWRSNEPLASNQIDQSSTDVQSLSPQAKTLNSTTQQNLKKTDEIISTIAVQPDSEAPENTVNEPLLPSERFANTLNTLKEKIKADNSELLSPMVGSNEQYFSLRREMLNALTLDPLLLDDLLELFEQDPDSLLGRELSAVLSETGSPKAQALALEMATDASTYPIDERAAALLMVVEMDGITSETRDGLLGNIQQETDSNLTQYSLMALKTAPSTTADYVNVHRVLQETLNRDDKHVRRHASYQIGEWATSNEDLAPLRTMALEEPDLNARIRAVMSLGISDFKSTENKTTLFKVIETDEDPRAQMLAWEALETYPLSDMEKDDYAALGERIQLKVDALQ